MQENSKDPFSDAVQGNVGNALNTGLRVVWENMLPELRKQGGAIVGTVAKTAARQVTSDEASAEKIGKALDSTFQLGMTFSANIHDLSSPVSNARGRLGDLAEKTQPFTASRRGKGGTIRMMRSSNEVVTGKRREVMENLRWGVYGAGAGLVSKTPDLLEHLQGVKQRMAVEGDASPAEGGDASLAASEAFDPQKIIDDRLHSIEAKMAESALLDPANQKMLEAMVRSSAPALQGYIRKMSQERFAEDCAYDLIERAVEAVEYDNGRGGVYVTFHDEDLPLADYILEIFKANQTDMGARPINDRSRCLPELKEACAQIAEEIEQNGLDPMALVALVGDRKVLDSELRVVPSETISEEIYTARRALERIEKIDTKEFIEESVFEDKKDFRAVLKGLKGEEKAFFCALFPDAVLQDYGGLKPKEINALKDEAAGDFAQQLTEAIVEIAGRGDDALHQEGLTEAERERAQSFAEDIEELGAEAFAEQLTGGKKQEAVELVRNAGTYWQDRVSGGGKGKASAASRVPEHEKPDQNAGFVEKTSRKADEEGRSLS